jgi:hypothetical protein
MNDSGWIMPAALKASDEQLITAYAELQSVHAVGARFGMRGSSAHERLAKLGAVKPRNLFTEAEKDRLRAEYWVAAETGRLVELAADMGRTKSFICTEARSLGLTKQNRKKAYLSEIISKNVFSWHKTHVHPRGMLGKKHSNKTKRNLSRKSSDRWHAMPKSEQLSIQSKAKRSWKAGWRTVGGQRIYFRSAWEANYARYLDWLKNRGEILSWEHEPKTFWFHNILRGIRSYLPDFRVVEKNSTEVFHEVKGWMDAASRTKIKRMAKYYPSVKLIVIDAKCYRSISVKIGRAVSGWES